MTDATTMLFGLPGVRIERVQRRADGTRVVDVVTDEPTAAECPGCGMVSTSVKERVSTSPRDIPYGEDRIVLRWNKVRWNCHEDYCAKKSPKPVVGVGDAGGDPLFACAVESYPASYRRHLVARDQHLHAATRISCRLPG